MGAVFHLSLCTDDLLACVGLAMLRQRCMAPPLLMVQPTSHLRLWHRACAPACITPPACCTFPPTHRLPCHPAGCAHWPPTSTGLAWPGTQYPSDASAALARPPPPRLPPQAQQDGPAVEHAGGGRHSG